MDVDRCPVCGGGALTEEGNGYLRCSSLLLAGLMPAPGAPPPLGQQVPIYQPCGTRLRSPRWLARRRLLLDGA